MASRNAKRREPTNRLASRRGTRTAELLTAIFALASSLIIGTSDFLLGVGSRQTPPQRVPIAANVSSGITLLLLALFIPATAVDSRSIVAGLTFGLVGAVGFTLYLMALSTGKMSLVAPITALTSSMMLIFIGVLGGDRPSALATTGVFLSLIAGVLISQGNGFDSDTSDRKSIGLALAAGVTFGAFFWSLSFINPEAGVWPFIVGRISAALLQMGIAIKMTGGFAVPRSTLNTSVPAGVLEAIAVLFAATAMQRGPISVAGVLTGLYPISTVILAWVILKERLSQKQNLAVVLAIVAVPLTAL